MAKPSRAVASLRHDARQSLGRIATLISAIPDVEDQDRALATLLVMSDHIDNRESLRLLVGACEELMALSEADRQRVTEILAGAEALIELQQDMKGVAN